jgi:RimJ/RimL family protein N-acetyltransferase
MLECLHEREELARFLARNPALYLYCLGDLDDPFWGRGQWFGRRRGAELEAVALLYCGLALPTLLAFAEPESHAADALKELLCELTPVLPARFYAHLSVGAEGVLEDCCTSVSQGLHYKMTLADRGPVRRCNASAAMALGAGDLPEIRALFERSYPGHSFEDNMLDAGPCFGLRADGGLVSFAGVHVYSKRYRAAAPGNIVTDPTWRSRGFAGLVTARLCQALFPDVDHIGLNVKADNQAAIACYEKFGFRIAAEYYEILATKNRTG